jgi:hypothetical protein
MTFAAEEPGEILSQDGQGRVLVSRERREPLLEQYDRSGMSGVEFARYVGIKYLSARLLTRGSHAEHSRRRQKVDSGPSQRTRGRRRSDMRFPRPQTGAR